MTEIVPGERPGSWVLQMAGMDQSHVDLVDPTRLDFDYMRLLADLLDAHGIAGEPLRVLHVGGAAMALPRYVAATRPRSPQIVLEPAAQVTELVRRELPLPSRSGIKVRPVGGRDGVVDVRDGQADVVVVDAFDDARVPADLVTREWYADLARVVTHDGLVLLNLIDSAPFTWTRRVLAAVRLSFPELLLVAQTPVLRGRRAGNLVVAAGLSSVPPVSRRRMAGAAYRMLDGTGISSSFGGGTPFTDVDTEPSPPVRA